MNRLAIFAVVISWANFIIMLSIAWVDGNWIAAWFSFTTAFFTSFISWLQISRPV